jgi:hypothetical protein
LIGATYFTALFIYPESNKTWSNPMKIGWISHFCVISHVKMSLFRSRNASLLDDRP